MRINRLGLFLTRKCNFKCIYCCVQTGKDPADKLTFAELKDLLLQAHLMGAKRLGISGEGEPLLDENLFPLFEYARTLGMGCALSTNGSLISKDIAQWLFNNEVLVFAKLDSFNHETQDRLAGINNCYEWVDYVMNGITFSIPKGLKYLLDAGYGGDKLKIFSRKLLTIETVITSLNIVDIPKIVRFCRQCNLLIYIERLMPPSSPIFDRKLIPPDEEISRLYKEVYPMMNWGSKLITKLRCGYEINPFIDINGDIRFCFSINKSAGNIRSTSLQILHAEQLRLKNKLSKKSPLIRLRGPGFRECRSRRFVRNEYDWPY